MRIRFPHARVSRFVELAILLAVGATVVQAQSAGKHEQSTSNDKINESLQDLQSQVAKLKSLLVELRDEVARSHAETAELRHEFETARAESNAHGVSDAIPPIGSATSARAEDAQSLAQRVTKLEEDQNLLSSKVDDQYQTKIESASKYRVRFSGIVLFSLFDNVGAVDNEDFPALASDSGPLTPGAAFGGSLRQSQLGFEAFGPDVAGARTTADVQFDFSGGFPSAPNGVTFGLVRLRTGTIRFDWGHTSIIAGQDSLFISPLAPSSVASLAEPALSYSGELWSWTPQVRIEHRLEFSEASDLLLQAGILDSLSGQTPASEYQQVPQIGQTTRQPGYAARLAWTHRLLGRSFTLGEGGYYARQDWGLSRKVDAWAATTDWTFPIFQKWDLSGQFYRGRAVGGLGGGIGGSIVSNGPIASPATQVHGLDSMGGWAQLEFRATSKLEFNEAFGQDNPEGSEIRNSSWGQQNYFSPWLARNQTWLANFIYRPRSDVLLSLEYRHLRTFTTVSEPYSADHVNMSVGVLF
ncbi:MAG TPA: hypothetical protein VEJ46_02635 [Candidatus Acidoferrum sp.]|nr:hypothetical protein [Candidatus Acidoferrum sp.]